MQLKVGSSKEIQVVIEVIHSLVKEAKAQAGRTRLADLVSKKDLR